MDTDLYSMGAYFSDRNPELVDEVIERSVSIEERGLAVSRQKKASELEEDLPHPVHRSRGSLLQVGRGMSHVIAVEPPCRPGRIRILIILAIAAGALLIGLIGMSTREPGKEYEDVVGIGDMRADLRR